ncbi:MAG: endonuclease [Gammaproteobacteria bacterium]|nr:MAG: endonuclease [Gammaproteobacteria bacterium]
MKKISIRVFWLMSLPLWLAACSAGDTRAPAVAAPVSIMTFNVENLFDNLHDAGKDDHTFWPLQDKQTEEHQAACASIGVERWRRQCLDWDWSDAVVEQKLSVIAAAILQVNGGRGADIVALQEVENLAILERLRNDYLASEGYRPAILNEGQDDRGIDVAFLSKLALAAPATLHRIEFAGEYAARAGDTRGILEATFVLPDGTPLTGYAVHFPAPFHPTEMRVAAYRRLNQLRSTLPPGRAAFAAGDFNTTAAEDREQALLQRLVRPHWTVVHEQGCRDCRGTQYYAAGDSWSFLDMILWSPGADRGAQATWNLRADSVRIANKSPGQVSGDGTPARFEVPGATGVSDHWPLVFEIEPK